MTPIEAIQTLRDAKPKHIRKLGKAYKLFHQGKVKSPTDVLGIIIATVQLPDDFAATRRTLRSLWDYNKFENFDAIRSFLIQHTGKDIDWRGKKKEEENEDGSSDTGTGNGTDSTDDASPGWGI